MDTNDIRVSCGEEGGSYFITVDDVRYKCSYAESVILSVLLHNKGGFYSKEELATIGWPGKLVSKNSVPVSIANLRKIFKNHTKLDVITNEKNKGYVIIIDKVKLTASTKIVETADTKERHEDLHASNVNVVPPASIEGVYKSKLSSIKLYISKGLAYPLLFVNIVFLLFVFFYNESDANPFRINVINSDKYIVVSTKDHNFLTRLKKTGTDQAVEHNSFKSIEDDLVLAKKENKNILFINSLEERIVVDCLVDDKLVSYSGDAIEAIISELNVKGCEL